MTDKEILDEVYNQLKTPVSEMPIEYRAWVWKCKLIQKFIEDEWQKREDPDFVPTKGLRNEVRIWVKPNKKSITIERSNNGKSSNNGENLNKGKKNE